MQFDIIHDLISSAVWYCWQIWYDLQFDIIHNLILYVIWYCLHSFILFFLFNFNCVFTSFYIFKLEHALLILYFLHYIVIENDDIFQKETFVTDMMLSWHLVSLNYSLCVNQIYISVCSFIILRKSSSSHLYFELSCHYKVSESSYVDHHHIERHIKTFLCYFYNTYRATKQCMIDIIWRH